MTVAAARPSRAQLYTLLGLMLFFWSANFVFAKVSLRELPSVLVVSMRTVLSGIFIWPVYAFARRRLETGVRKWTRADVPVLLACGLIGVVGNQLLFIVGLGLTSVAHGSIITAMGPMFVLIGASVAGHERIAFKKIAGMITAGCGVAALQFGRGGGGATLKGDLIMVVSVLVFAGFSVLGKRVVSEFGSVTLNTFAFMSGAVLLAPYTLWQVAQSDLSRVSAGAWAGVLYMAIFPSIAGYMIYSYALRYLPASQVSSVAYLQPVLATVFAIVFLRENPGPAFVGGAALVLGGVYITERR